eukprot:CAMPEP_0206445918 /NCGR_PEP_ID=MMETSP0324_2-20121206/15812_1 /ASSEMBLY_ACC=CAM_ASM_000836 /TAXON_ID=2866 /ORGANISM="Crypthecodinium cohnii, Strain Seligo" /LENGTH=511 /DNA_ID=CAMNT_0053914261 /DNA_START=159 /DNA_END=1694 /DNA_ORIENTATION=-
MSSESDYSTDDCKDVKAEKRPRGVQQCLSTEMGRVLVAGSGFLADGYDLFVIGLVEMIFEAEYVKTGIITESEYSWAKGTMASSALLGAVLGQIVLGTLADRIGRRVVFIVTAVLIILGSLLSAMASPNLIAGRGPDQVFVQIAIARLIMGFGIGGEYPLSASIAAEGCTKRRSGTLMALVFSNQGSGYLLACLVMIFLHGTGCSNEVTWRGALAFGAVVPGLALPFRMMMHESDDFEKVLKQREAHQANVDSRKTMKRYTWHLIGTAANWFLWDIVWYSNGLFSQDIAQVLNVFGEDLMGKFTKKLIIVLCMLPGFALSVAFLNKLGRKNLQILGYVAIAILFFILGLGYNWLKSSSPGLFFVLYAMTFLFANFGPNTTTYVIPGEIFPSQIKATFHGFSAASGKIGGVVGAELFPRLDPKSDHGKVICLLLCAFVAVAGALFTFAFTPRYAAETLEVKLPGETVGYVPLRWQKKDHASALQAHSDASDATGSDNASDGCSVEDDTHNLA